MEKWTTSYFRNCFYWRFISSYVLNIRKVSTILQFKYLSILFLISLINVNSCWKFLLWKECIELLHQIYILNTLLPLLSDLNSQPPRQELKNLAIGPQINCAECQKLFLFYLFIYLFNFRMNIFSLFRFIKNFLQYFFFILNFRKSLEKWIISYLWIFFIEELFSPIRWTYELLAQYYRLVSFWFLIFYLI